jgi:hypothetical protein
MSRSGWLQILLNEVTAHYSQQEWVVSTQMSRVSPLNCVVLKKSCFRVLLSSRLHPDFLKDYQKI